MFYISSYCDLLPVLLFILFFRKLSKSKGLWAIVLSCFFSIAIIKILEANLLTTQYRHYFYSLFTLLEYIFFALFLWFNLRSRKSKRILILISVFFILFLFVYTVLINFKRVDSVTIGVETITILGFSFFFLYEQIKEPKLNFINDDYRFWIVVGMILYLAGSFFIYIFAEQVSQEVWHQYRWLTWMFYIIKSIFFTIALLVYLRKPMKTSSTRIIPNLDMTF